MAEEGRCAGRRECARTCSFHARMPRVRCAPLPETKGVEALHHQCRLKVVCARLWASMGGWRHKLSAATFQGTCRKISRLQKARQKVSSDGDGVTVRKKKIELGF